MPAERNYGRILPAVAAVGFIGTVVHRRRPRQPGR